MRRLVDASRMRIPVPFRSRPRWSRRIPTGIAPGIGHGHAWVFMKSHWQQGGYPKLAASAPNPTVAARQTWFPPDSEAGVQDDADAALADSRTFPTPNFRCTGTQLLARGVDPLIPYAGGGGGGGDLSVLARIRPCW